jgi:hypothetical protein
MASVSTMTEASFFPFPGYHFDIVSLIKTNVPFVIYQGTMPLHRRHKFPALYHQDYKK